MDYEAAWRRAQTRGELVWHYTSLDTLARILESNSLLATEVAFQNDIRETVTADSAFRDALEALSGEDRYRSFSRQATAFLRDIDSGAATGSWSRFERELTENARFILCASDEPDHLYAWRTYANPGIGCAIGLDPKVPLAVVTPGLPGQSRVRYWQKVSYEPADTREKATEALRRLAEQLILANERGIDEGPLIFRLERLRSDVRAIAKDPAFADEREQRVTIDRAPTVSAVITTPSSMGPRPHLRLAAVDRWDSIVVDATAAQKLPIRAVRLGPNAPDSAIAATRWSLLANGYSLDGEPVDPTTNAETWSHAVIIDRSEHPYRA